jgi:hypothetical protein
MTSAGFPLYRVRGVKNRRLRWYSRVSLLSKQMMEATWRRIDVNGEWTQRRYRQSSTKVR